MSGFLAVLFLACAGWGAWAAGDGITNPALAERICRDTISRVQARDALGKDAARNGYADLEECLRRGAPQTMLAPFRALGKCVDYQRAFQGGDLLAAYKPEGAKMQEAVKAFETVLPVLDRALARPNFIWPSEWEKGAAACFPNFILMKDIAANLVAYAKVCAVTGKLSRATHYILVTLARLGGLKLLCALQLHRLEKGSYPETLDQLVPGVLVTLPRDYLSQDGKFTYKKVGDDFQLSSTVAPALQKVLPTTTFSYRPPHPMW